MPSDKERLDWLESNLAEVWYSRGRTKWSVSLNAEWVRKDSLFDTPRAAIDYAMSKEREDHE